jgi:hypothetical protein
MAFMRNAGDITPEESLIYNYWSTILHLLKLGIAWEAISNFTGNEISLIIGIDAAYQQKEQDDQARQMAQHKMPSMAGMGMPSI